MANPFSLGTSLAAPILGNANGTNYTMCDLADENGYAIIAHGIGYAGTLPTTTKNFQYGCLFIESDKGSVWINVAAPTTTASWTNIK